MTKYPLAGMQYFDCVSASGSVYSGSYSREVEMSKFIVFNVGMKILFNVLFSSCNRPLFWRVLLHIIVNCKHLFHFNLFIYLFIYLFILYPLYFGALVLAVHQTAQAVP